MKETEVLKQFGEGFDCSQVILMDCAQALGMSREEAAKLAACFGGDMWQGDTCGAVSGALMAIGCKYGHSRPNDADKKNVMLAKLNEFQTKFKEKRGTLICRELLGYDLSKPEEMQKIMDEGLLTTLCPKVVCEAREVLQQVL